MPYCRKCGKEIDETSMFCPQCGQSVAEPVAATEGPKAKTDSAPKQDRPRQVYASSQSCRSQLTSEWEKKLGISRAINGLTSTFALAVLFGPPLLAYLRGEPERKVDKMLPSAGLCIFVIAAMIGIMVLIHFVVKQVQETYEMQLARCGKESLRVESDGIHGTTPYGALSLPYRNISGVSVLPFDSVYKNWVIKNEILTITEKSGKKHTFITFTNAHELGSIIRSESFGKY